MAVTSFIQGVVSKAMSILNTTDQPLKEALPFEDPTVEDVLLVKNIIQKASPLPLELVDVIIDHAEYWPCTSSAAGPFNVHGDTVDQFQDRHILRSLPLGYCPDSSSANHNLSTIKLLTFNQHLSQSLPGLSENMAANTPHLLEAWAERSLPRDAHPCRKIVFHFKSRDQGWGGGLGDRGTYRGSFTWFDAGRERVKAVDMDALRPVPGNNVYTELRKRLNDLNFEQRIGKRKERQRLRWVVEPVDPLFRPPREGEPMDDYMRNAKLDHPFLPHDKSIQKNLTATRETQEHEIVWRWNDDIDPDSQEAEALDEMGRGKATSNGEFVRSLELGDIVTVWARARFPGWSNNIDEARMDIYWAV